MKNKRASSDDFEHEISIDLNSQKDPNPVQNEIEGNFSLSNSLELKEMAKETEDPLIIQMRKDG